MRTNLREREIEIEREREVEMFDQRSKHGFLADRDNWMQGKSIACIIMHVTNKICCFVIWRIIFLKIESSLRCKELKSHNFECAH